MSVGFDLGLQGYLIVSRLVVLQYVHDFEYVVHTNQLTLMVSYLQSTQEKAHDWKKFC